MYDILPPENLSVGECKKSITDFKSHKLLSKLLHKIRGWRVNMTMVTLGYAGLGDYQCSYE